MLELMGGSIIDVPGIKLGHHTLTKRPTGCTVLLCEEEQPQVSMYVVPHQAPARPIFSIQ